MFYGVEVPLPYIVVRLRSRSTHGCRNYTVNLSESPNNEAGRIAEPKNVAVLPFDNLSDDMGQDYFADGISDYLITSLAQFSDLFVIARD